MQEADVVAGRYRLLSMLGAGGMGQVWLAEDELLNRRVAVKVLLAAAGDDADMTQRIMREARTAARLSHPNAVAVHDLIIEGGKPYVVMEYVSGNTLDDRIKKSGRLDAASVAPVIGQVAAALAAAHRLGVVHRDVKPANILITSEGIARLADFGIARAETDSQLTGTGMVIGSLAYMSPEVAEGGNATALSDVWSLGATLFAAVEGRAPFEGDTTVRMLYRLFHEQAPAPTRGGHLTDLIIAMLARDPTQRPSAADIANQLTPWITQSPHVSPLRLDNPSVDANYASSVVPAAAAASNSVPSWPATEIAPTPSPSHGTGRQDAAYAPTELRDGNPVPLPSGDGSGYASTSLREGDTGQQRRGNRPGYAPTQLRDGAGYAPTQLREVQAPDPRRPGRKSRRPWYIVGSIAAAAVLGVGGFIVFSGSSKHSTSSSGGHSSSCAYDQSKGNAFDVANDYVGFASINQVTEAQRCTLPNAVPESTTRQIVGKQYTAGPERGPYVFDLDNGAKVTIEVTAQDGKYYVTSVALGTQ